jgi:hypothetical protein
MRHRPSTWDGPRWPAINPMIATSFCIGFNLADVLVECSDLYGDGVNIAARLESIAEPGGILVSGTAYDHAKINAGFDDLGPNVWRTSLSRFECTMSSKHRVQ